MVLQARPPNEDLDSNAVYLGASLDVLPKKVDKLTLYEPILGRFYASKSKVASNNLNSKGNH
jgi:hypothetical protein